MMSTKEDLPKDQQKSKEKILKDLEQIFAQRMKDEKNHVKPLSNSQTPKSTGQKSPNPTPEIKDKGIMTEQEVESLENVFKDRNLSLIYSNRKKSSIETKKSVPTLNNLKEEPTSRTLSSLLSPRPRSKEDEKPKEELQTVPTTFLSPRAATNDLVSGLIKVGSLFKRREKKSISKKPSILVKRVEEKQEEKPKTVRTGTVLYNFIAEMDDEISVNEGDIVEVLGDDSEGWTDVKFQGKLGIIPTAYFAEVTLPETDDYREKILSEFYGTEVNYVENLKRMVECFVVPLEQILPSKLTSKVFAHIKVVIGVNQIFLNKLESILKNETLDINERQEKLATVLLNLSVTFKLYVPYISDFENSQKLIREEMNNNKKLKQFLKEVGTELKNRGCTITDLQSYMILPIQRLPRYRLLLADLLKHTPEDPKDIYQMMEQAYQAICKIVEYCNEKQREIESSKYLFNLQKKYELPFNPSQKIIQELKKVKLILKDEELQCQEMCLFDDILIVLNSKKIIVNRENVSAILKEDKRISLKMNNENNIIMIVDENDFENFYQNLEKWK